MAKSTPIVLDANGEELEFIRFLNGLLPQKPELDKVSILAVEKLSSLIPFDLLILCVEHEDFIHVVLYQRGELRESYLEAAKENVLKGKNIIFPSWKEKVVEERMVRLPEEESGASSAAFSSTLFQKIEGVSNGFVQVFSGERDAYDEKHEFILGMITYWLVSYFVLSKIYDRLEALAVTDPLTGVFNRRKLDQELDREVERSRRYGLEFAIIMIDVDDLKQINDTYGHHAGDKLLQRCAKVMVGNLRKVDIVTRIGGDEFMIILPHTRPEGARVVAERILDVYNKGILEDTGGAKIAASLTMSVTSFYSDDTPESLYKRVDAGLNEAKRFHKGRFHIIKKVYL